MGWEKFGGDWFLRMALAEPRLTPVWPGGPTIAKPEGELRRVTDEVLTPEQADAFVKEYPSAQREITPRDVRLLSQALAQYPGLERKEHGHARPDLPPSPF